ncbi:MAG: hypothetical protein H9855_01070 [Candidatus Acinetobacter avistercoris]|nr:hypothetical protein [Candidatus Acinetobacter avistercoris]
MKRIMMVGLFLGLTLNVYAKPVNDSTHEKNCRMYMEMANAIMKQKQGGVPLIKALEANDAALKKNPDNNMHKIVSLIIRDAYEQPNYSTPSIKEEQLNEFSAKYYLGCAGMYE